MYWGQLHKFLRMKPNDFLAFIQISSMWSLQDIFELMDTPRYLIPETQLSGKPLIVYLAQTVLSLLEICIMEHLCGFKVICQEFTHNLCWTRSSSNWMALFEERIVRYTKQSSANSLTDEVILSVMSLIKIRKSNGPSTVPCGTPEVTGTTLDDTPSTITHCFLLLRRLLIHCNVLLLMP